MTKILLVEDDKSLREIYGVRLLAEGYDIVSAGDGEEALAAAIREKPTLIISDVMMPRISGFEMLDLLRSNDTTKNIKVIMMTALSSDQQRERGERLGADRYLVKSQVGIEDVVRTVHDVLQDKSPDSAAVNTSSTQAVAAPPVASSTVTPAANQPTASPPPEPTPPAAPVSQSPTLPSAPTTAPAANLPPSNSVAPTNPSPTPPPAQMAPVPLPSVAPPPAEPPTPSVERPFQPPPTNPPAAMQSPAPTDSPAVLDTAPPQPAADFGARVIEPTGSSLNPKININELLSQEETIAATPSTDSPTTTASQNPSVFPQ
jgi:CheY-like chemotaxis protein